MNLLWVPDDNRFYNKIIVCIINNVKIVINYLKEILIIITVTYGYIPENKRFIIIIITHII